MKPVIFIDMDDVLFDWCTFACKTFDLSLDDPDIRHQIENVWGGIDKWVPDDKLWDVIHGIGAKWWEDLPLLPWANSLYAEMSKLGEVCILTAPSDHPSCAAGKIASIKKHFNTKNFLIGRPKYLAAGTNKILIDDRPENCIKFHSHGGNSILWPSAVKLLRLGIGEQIVQKCVYTVEEIIMFIDTDCPILPMDYILETEDADKIV